MNRITDENYCLFQKLRTKRLKGWETFSDPEYIKVWEGVIEKYPETAHFIYELVQNADDALATEASVILFPNHLIFKHNGKRQFTLTDVDKLKEGTGDINSITAVGYSTKTDEEQKIGKFGVGFKSVFQYTEIPSIYDDTFWFKIENYMVPKLLEHDHPLRKKGETLFDIPFKQPEKAFREICERLQNLNMPILFLPNIKKITWKIDGEERVHTYSKNTISSKERKSIHYELCQLKEFQKIVNLYVFRKSIFVSKGRFEISVGYFLKSDGTLDIDIRPNIFCFFPTRERFDGCFVSHAPFLLTDNRESIKTYEPVNTEFLHGLAELAADALLILRDIKQKDGKSLLIDDNLFSIIKTESQDNRNIYLREQYLKCIKSNRLVLSRSNKYIETSKALIASEELERLFSKKQLAALYSDGFDFVYLKNYRSQLRGIASLLGIATFDAESLAERLSAGFMADQPQKWTYKLVEYIKENARKLWNTDKVRDIRNYSYWKDDSWESLKFRFAPIAKASNGEWVAPYTKYKEKPNILLPFDGFDDAVDEFGLILDKGLYNAFKDFYEHIGLREPNMSDYIEKKILTHYDSSTVDQSTILKDFDFIYKTLPNSSDPGLVKMLKDKWPVAVSEKDKVTLYRLSILYLPDADLIEFMGGNDQIKCIDCSYYASENYSEDEVYSLVSR